MKLLKLLLSLFTGYKRGGFTGEVPSPRVAINPNDITYDAVSKVLRVFSIEPDIWVTTVWISNSMEAGLDDSHIVVLSNNLKYMDDLNVGDVVVWEKPGLKIIHYISKISEDKDGWYCKTRGWNLSKDDPFRIRKEEITWVGLIVFWCDKTNQIYSRVYKGE